MNILMVLVIFKFYDLFIEDKSVSSVSNLCRMSISCFVLHIERRYSILTMIIHSLIIEFDFYVNVLSVHIITAWQLFVT